MKTIRLFDQDSHLYTFTATILSVTPGKAPDTLDVVLDATAFFPEGGGQYPDRGELGHVPVIDVQEKDGVITHTLSAAPLHLSPTAFKAGDVVTGQVDTNVRFVRMQNHSGEHIISGLVHRLYGYKNVGFHLGDRGDTPDVTLDFDGVLTREQLNAIEDEANAIVAACLPVKAYYPAPRRAGHPHLPRQTGSFRGGTHRADRPRRRRQRPLRLLRSPRGHHGRDRADQAP